MMTKIKLKALNCVILMVMFFINGCSKSETIANVENPKPTTITNLNFSSSSQQVTNGESITLKVNHLPSNLSAPSYTWTTSDPTVATVTNGIVSALKVGTTTITAQAASLNLKAEITINVVAVTANTLSLTTTNNTLALNEKTQISYEILPATTPDKESLEIEWSSSNTDIATVSSTGEVTGKAFGTVNIIGKIKDTNIQGTIEIVVKAVSVTSVSISEGNQSLKIADTKQLNNTVLPENASNKNVTWSSSNTNVATVSSIGLVKAIAAGTATITATTEDENKTASISVTVTNIPVTGITLSVSSTSLSKGNSHTINHTISPSNATNKSVSYSSNNSGVATVNSNGVVTAIAPGTATITVKTNDGEKTASLTVTVLSTPVSSISISPSSNINVIINANTTLTATVLPANATNKTVTWASLNTNIATVSSSGIVTGKAAGTATITATADGKATSVEVVVKEPTITSIGQINYGSINNIPDLKLLKGSGKKLVGVPNPTNALNDITFSSGTTSVVTVDTEGNVNALAIGSGIITAKSTSVPSVTKNLSVTVGSTQSLIEVTQTKSKVELTNSGATTNWKCTFEIRNNSHSNFQVLSYEVKTTGGVSKIASTALTSGFSFRSPNEIGTLDFNLNNITESTYKLHLTIKYGDTQEVLIADVKNIGTQ